ncbi:asparagine synthetase A [Thermoplasma sp.]|uniref:asparagine synthetase A n=1 Tax=Thermoplasma sp. TaxID=1973142 RepID=UPI0012763CE1|nr:asparagine synthetase A [Thermoplasma sp.]KAA8923501.1 MAG: asparagine synthetase [Thermoplasma sp.]
MESGEINALVEEISDHLEKPELYHALKVQSSIRSITSEFLKERGFIEVPPVIISVLTDPLNHPVFDPTIDYYGYRYSLTKSMIFHKHLLTKHFDRIFTFSPNIRLEEQDKVKTGRHLAEFTQLDLEMKGASRDEVIGLGEEMIIDLFRKIKKTNGEDLKFFGRDLAIPSRPFKRIAYLDAYRQYGEDFEHILSSEMKEPFWIVDIPLEKREFYDREDPSRPGILVDMDLIYPEGYGEALSGGEREYELSRIIDRIHRKGQTEEQFKWYIEFAREGLNPSAGFGIGIERLTRFICGLERIEDAHPFPKIPGHLSL